MKQKDTLKRCYIQDSTEHQPIWYICVLFDGNGDRDSILGNFSQGKMLRLDRRRWRWFSTPLTISTIYWVPVIFVAVTSPSGGGTVYCMVLEGVGDVSYPPLPTTLGEYRQDNPLALLTIALHTCIAFKKLPSCIEQLQPWQWQCGKKGVSYNK